MTPSPPEYWVAKLTPNPGVNYTVTLWSTTAASVDDQSCHWDRERSALRAALREAAESGDTKRAQALAKKLNSLNDSFLGNLFSLRAHADCGRH